MSSSSGIDQQKVQKLLTEAANSSKSSVAVVMDVETVALLTEYADSIASSILEGSIALSQAKRSTLIDESDIALLLRKFMFTPSCIVELNCNAQNFQQKRSLVRRWRANITLTHYIRKPSSLRFLPTLFLKKLSRSHAEETSTKADYLQTKCFKSIY